MWQVKQRSEKAEETGGSRTQTLGNIWHNVRGTQGRVGQIGRLRLTYILPCVK